LARTHGMWAFFVVLSAFSSSVVHMGPTPPKTIRRVVSLAPSLTEMVCALDACQRLVGVTSYDTYPASVQTLPKVADFHTPNAEKIALLRPDVVLAVPTSAGRKPVETLARLGMSVVVVPASSLQDVWDAMDFLGHVLQRIPQALALKKKMLDALGRFKHASHTPALMLVGTQPLVGVGHRTYLSSLLNLAGGNNVLVRGGDYPTLDEESIAALKPHTVVVIGMTANTVSLPETLQAWLDQQHIRTVYVHHDALLRPGPRLVEAVSVLEKALH
jgi:iron complex transport system substrate-binding protein